MSKSLYIEAIEAAEQIKLSAEEKVKQKLIESMSPQIKLLVEKRLLEDVEVSEDFEEKEDYPREYGMETVDEGMGGCCDETEEVVELDENSKRILSKFITDNAKKEAMHNKIEQLRESLNSLKKVVILSKNQKINNTIKEKIVVLHKNIIEEIKNIKSNDIFKKDSNLLREFYRLNKELNSMSKRRSSKDYLSEDLETLLEMNLFEADEEGVEGEKAMPSADDDDDDELSVKLGDLEDDLEGELEEDPEAEEDEEDEESADEPQGEVGPDTTVEDLAMMAGLLETEIEEGEEGVEGEGLGEILEIDETLAAAIEEKEDHTEDVEEGSCGSSMEGMYESNDRILEIDENMLRREIGRMKALREGEVSADKEISNLDEMKTKAAKVVRKNRMLESKLSQYKKALLQMKGQLQEMNLFNAKLLYANKLMQNRDLTLKQQRNIVESLDDAKTLSEAKILFESLSKSLVSGSAKRSENLSEGAIRRSTGSASAPVRSAQTLNESVALNRWATLAGIKK